MAHTFVGQNLDYIGTLPLRFWDELREEIQTDFDALQEATKPSYSLTLNRGAPRKR